MRHGAARARTDDFAAFVPALERNVQLARAYGECLVEEDGSVYEALLADYDFGLRTQRLRELFSELAERLPPLAQEASERTPRRSLQVPVAAQRAAVAGVLARVGVEDSSWRVDVSAHPFSTAMALRDSRVTTRYSDGDVESLLSSLHEYGHALYERQVAPELERTNLGTGTSMSVHESQSKLWENHVARSPAFAHVLATELHAGGFDVEPGDLHAVLVGVEPSLIRVSADPLTYPLHIVLRFELELALVEGELDGRRSTRRLARAHARAARTRCPLRRARLPAGRALGHRRVRLLPELRPRVPDRRAAVGGDRRRAG